MTSLSKRFLFPNCVTYIGNLKDQYASSLCLNTTGGSDSDNEVVCAEGFYLDNNSHPICIPLCAHWISASETVVGGVIFVVSIILATVSSIILFVTLYPRRDTM